MPDVTHQEAVDTLATERYLLDEMSDSDRQLFEEHYFSCDSCAQDVRMASRMTETARGVLAADGTTRPTTGTVVSMPAAKPARWSGSAFVPWALAASLALFAAYQSLLVIPGLRSPRAVDAFTLRPDSRGQEAVVASAGDAMLIMEVNDVREGADLKYEIKAADGAQVVSRHGRAPRAGAPFLVLVPSSALAADTHYVVTIEDGATGQPVGTYRFLRSR
jgi:hypothetical protein